MQFFRTREFWGLRKFGRVERALLLNIPEAANSEGHRAATERLFPSPLAEEEQFEEGHDEFLQDWQDFVASTLRDEFAAAIDTVKSDLDNMQMEEEDSGQRDDDLAEVEDSGDSLREDDEDMEEEGEPQPYYLVLPLANGEHWFSALNQARLVMAERYDLYDEDGRMRVPQDGPSAGDDEIYRIMVQNDLYGYIQEFLVEQVMSV